MIRPEQVPVRAFLMDFYSFMHPSEAETTGISARAREAFRQSIAGDCAPYVVTSIETRDERVAKHLDAIRASEGTETPFVALATPFYATEEAARLADEMFQCKRCLTVSTRRLSCPGCGADR